MNLPARFPRPRQARAAHIAADQLSGALAVPPPPATGLDRSPQSPRWRAQSLSKGAAGIAILHGTMARAGLPGQERAQHWLAAATRDELSAGPGAGLWYGAPAVAFAVAAAAPPGTCQQAMERLDAAVATLTRKRLVAAHARIDSGAPPSLAEFDLVRGLTGLGAYLLRFNPGGDTIRQVLAYLVRLTQPLPASQDTSAVPGWWTSDLPSGHPPDPFRGGYADLGIAHGICGPLALLALAMRRGITVPGHAEAIGRICRYLDTWRQDRPAGPWWPGRVTLADAVTGKLTSRQPGRPSWCYGTPGIARVQQLAGLALADPARQRAAEHALTRCLSDPAQTSLIGGSSLCHGWSGVAVTAMHAAADALDPGVAGHLDQLLSTLLRHAAAADADRPGLIEGSAGLALTLHTMTAPASAGWESCLLIT